MYATIRSYHGVDQNRTAELTTKVNRDPRPEAQRAARLRRLLPRRRRQRHLHLARSLRDTRAGRRVDQARLQVDPRREARHADAQRAQDHERQGRRSQLRARPGRVAPAAPHPRGEGPALPGPLLGVAQTQSCCSEATSRSSAQVGSPSMTMAAGRMVSNVTHRRGSLLGGVARSSGKAPNGRDSPGGEIRQARAYSLKSR